MDILSVSPFGHKRALILTIVSILAFGSLMPLLLVEPVVAIETDSSPMALQADQRTGVHNLDDYPPEYFGNGESSEEYFGAKMEKLDFNGDDIIDVAISGPGKSSIYIFNGANQLKYPNLKISPSTADWVLTGSSKMGTDFAVGDVNGDGCGDVLASNARGSSGNQAFLFYGGTWVDSVAEFTANASFNFESYGYYGSFAALGDLNGDGLDEVIAGDGGYQYITVYAPDPRVPSGQNYHYFYYYGQVLWWFSTSGTTTPFSGSYSYSSADGRVYPHASYSYDYGSYGRTYAYQRLGSHGVATGDMNGDGRDELALGCNYMYDGSNSYRGGVIVMYPGSTIESYSKGTTMESSPHVNWVSYVGGSYMDSAGADPLIYDYNDDGLGDLVFNQGYYSTSYANNGKYCWIIDGSTTIPSGEKKLSSSSSYTKRFEVPGEQGFGAHTFGDYDGDGKADIALGSMLEGRVYVLLNDQFDDEVGTIDVTENPALIVEAPSGASNFASSCIYYRYYSYNYGHIYRTLMFLNRDSDGLDDLFIADPYASSEGMNAAGVVYGVSNFDMFGIGTFSASNGDLPDGKTFYAEYNSYKFTGSAWNRWNLYGSQMAWEYVIGNYHGTIVYSNPSLTPAGAMLTVENDEFGIIKVEPGSMRLYETPSTNTLAVEFKVMFTSNLPVEGDLDVIFDASCAHISYRQELKEIGAVKNRMRFVGDLQAFVDDGSTRELREVKNDGWVQENSELMLTGMKLIYNGTEDFMRDFEIEPFYPSDDLFNITLINSLGLTDVDNSSSGREFTVSGGVGDRPLEIDFLVSIEGIPVDRLVEELDPFTVRVDVDVPTAPPGVRIHADSFDDMNTIVDNDNELYITWHEPGEFNSGIHYYEVECNGTITTTDVTFAKVETDKTGTIEVRVRAIDKVGFVGEWTTSSILIDKESLEFTSYSPGEDVWVNSLNPQVGISITDVGGRSIIGNSVMYVLSQDGGETWGEWTSADIELNSKTLDVYVHPMGIEGDNNMIIFRASDEAGNVLDSDPYNIMIDTSGVEFMGILVDDSDEWEGVWLPDPEVNIKVMMSDGSSGIDGSTFEYRITTRGRVDLNSAPWMSASSGSGVDVTADLGTLDLVNGDKNYIQFRSRDLVGNGYSYSEAFNIWVNTLPEVIIHSPEMDSKYIEDEMVLFDASMTFDTDGDLITYTWTTSYGDVTDMVIGEDAEDTVRFDQLLPIGMHTITLTVSDGVHEIVSAPIYVNITARIHPVWYSAEDNDGDGMPNYWEYNYYLGWDDETNKDSMYNPSTMDEMSREALFDQLMPNFRNKTSAVTDANDADGDGHTDFEEYLAGTNPTDALNFPVYDSIGSEPEDSQSYLIWILLLVCIIVIIIVLVVVLLSSAAIKKDLESSRIKDAEDEKALMDNALTSGGQERLDQLLAAARGEAAPALPGSPGGQPAALPSAEPGAQPMDGQPMDAQPMDAQPMDAQPMQAAPMGQPMPEGQNYQ